MRYASSYQLVLALLVAFYPLEFSLADSEGFFIERKKSQSPGFKAPRKSRQAVPFAGKKQEKPVLPKERIEVALFVSADDSRIRSHLALLESIVQEYKASVREIVLIDAAPATAIYGREPQRRSRRRRQPKEPEVPENLDGLLELYETGEFSKIDSLMKFRPSSIPTDKRQLAKLQAKLQDGNFKEAAPVLYSPEKAKLLSLVQNLSAKDQERLGEALNRRHVAESNHYLRLVQESFDPRRFGLTRAVHIPLRNKFFAVRQLKRLPVWTAWIKGQRLVIQGYTDPREIINKGIQFLALKPDGDINSIVSGNGGKPINWKRREEHISIRLTP